VVIFYTTFVIRGVNKMKNIVTISGTNRPQNFTFRALNIVNEELRGIGIEPVVFDARELSLSFPGHPPTGDEKKLKTAVKEAAGIILATPEYHGTFAAMTKLIIENLGFPSALSGKPVALIGVAAGKIGAIKSLEQLKGVCSHIGAIVVPGSVSIAGIQQVFDETGQCTDEKTRKSLQDVAHSLINFLENYICPKFALEEMIRKDIKSWSANL
jgi:NAD(P)H-dependent FMN reductase